MRAYEFLSEDRVDEKLGKWASDAYDWLKGLFKKGAKEVPAPPKFQLFTDSTKSFGKGDFEGFMYDPKIKKLQTPDGNLIEVRDAESANKVAVQWVVRHNPDSETAKAWRKANGIDDAADDAKKVSAGKYKGNSFWSKKQENDLVKASESGDTNSFLKAADVLLTAFNAYTLGTGFAAAYDVYLLSEERPDAWGPELRKEIYLTLLQTAETIFWTRAGFNAFKMVVTLKPAMVLKSTWWWWKNLLTRLVTLGTKGAAGGPQVSAAMKALGLTVGTVSTLTGFREFDQDNWARLIRALHSSRNDIVNSISGSSNEN